MECKIVMSLETLLNKRPILSQDMPFLQQVAIYFIRIFFQVLTLRHKQLNYFPIRRFQIWNQNLRVYVLQHRLSSQEYAENLCMIHQDKEALAQQSLIRFHICPFRYVMNQRSFSRKCIIVGENLRRIKMFYSGLPSISMFKYPGTSDYVELCHTRMFIH